MVKRTGAIQITTMVPEELAERIKALSDRTRVPQAAYFREGLEYVLKKYEKSKRKARTTGD